jgi:glycosyltransferase involved in cell wall biosynthesis
MKIAWVTPFSQRSAIGRVSATVTDALFARNHEVVIIRSEYDRHDATPTHPSLLATVWWHDVSARDIEEQNDIIVLNFGDNYNYHAGALALADNGLSLGIFHDYYLYNLFNRWIFHNELGEDLHQREICSVYGESVLPLAAKAWRNSAPVEQIAGDFPMTEWLARHCGAALAHSRFYLPRLENSCPGPTAVAPLCFDDRGIAPLPKRTEQGLVVTTVGVINPNKCVDTVIRAIAVSPTLRSNCRFRLVGAIIDSERSRLKALCQQVGFEHLDILGEVNNDTLVQELECADLLCCLRKPVLEGASASAIEGMKSGRPLIVADAGFYADLPDDLVFKVPPCADEPSLTALLERLAADEGLRRRIGTKAQNWALQTFTTDAYLAVLEGLMVEFIKAKPLLAVASRTGRQLAALGMEPDDPAVQQIGERMAALFGNN